MGFIKAPFAYLVKKLAWILRNITYMLRMVWYLFPAVFFLLAAYACFWTLGQGQDVLISAIEKKGANWIVLLSLIFWVLITWYTGRILIYHKPDLYKQAKTLCFHGPRLLGFMGFSIIWMSLLQLPSLPDHNFTLSIKKATATRLFWIATPLAYILLYWLFKRWRVYYFWNVERTRASTIYFEEMEKARQQRYKRIFWILRILLAVVFIINVIFDNGNILVFSIILLQIMYLFSIIWRRGALLFEKMPTRYSSQRAWLTAEKINCDRLNWFQKRYYDILYYANISKKERGFFMFFNLVSIAGLVCYGWAIAQISFANRMGSLSFVLLAFGVLVGFFAIVSIFSVIMKMNFHIFLFALVVILGLSREPHYVRTFTANSTAKLTQRPLLKNYFLKWLQDRKSIIESKSSYPVFFVLSDGGASRSGYWTAAALGRMEDATKGEFSKHLFCLSGTSGGGVGVGVFFTLLHHKQQLQQGNYEKSAKEYLQNDFLTYTLTRMLGPDFFRPLLPTDYMFKTMTDRAGALEKAMEIGVSDNVFLKGKMAQPFSAFIDDSQTATLPLLCINTTRMQDGRPGVITNVNLIANNEVFNKRVDVISLLGQNRDIHMSTAVVLGARFPYISPAGRIDQWMRKRDTSKGILDSSKVHYFVDGGYFDNSGAGVVNEMIVELRRLRDSLVVSDSSYAFANKLDFYIIHATNSPIGEPKVERVHFLRNDLMAPVLTIVGAYGTQTDINNLRLKRYLLGVYGNTNHYKNVDLYYRIHTDTLSFPMNWAISDYYIKRMNRQLDTSRQMNAFMKWLQSSVQ